MRKLLGMRGQPAVLLLHRWSPYINRHAFYASSEDGINTIAAYYGARGARGMQDLCVYLRSPQGPVGFDSD